MKVYENIGFLEFEQNFLIGVVKTALNLSRNIS